MVEKTVKAANPMNSGQGKRVMKKVMRRDVVKCGGNP